MVLVTSFELLLRLRLAEFCERDTHIHKAAKPGHSNSCVCVCFNTLIFACALHEPLFHTIKRIKYVRNVHSARIAHVCVCGERHWLRLCLGLFIYADKRSNKLDKFTFARVLNDSRSLSPHECVVLRRFRFSIVLAVCWHCRRHHHHCCYRSAAAAGAITVESTSPSLLPVCAPARRSPWLQLQCAFAAPENA